MRSPSPAPKPDGAGAALRLGLLGAFMLAAFGFLAARLHTFQVVENDLYEGRQNRISLRRVRLPATRGRILDRNGAVLADNRPSWCIAFYIEELRAAGPWSNTVNRVDGEIDRTAAFLGREREVSRDAIARHVHASRPIPLVAFSDLSDAELARFCEWDAPPPGSEVFVRAARVYPEKDLACHVVGYVGRGEPKPPPPGEFPDEFDPSRFNYFFHDLEGRSGIERTGDAALAGRGGLETLRIDAIGYKREVYPEIAPEPGRDVVLTLDAGLQRAAERALGTNRAAAVVLDVRNGDVLALASSPRYDLSRFTPSVPAAYYARLSADPSAPFLNRAASGRYAPGSVVKPVVALAALRAGAIAPDTHLFCDGKYSFGTDAQGREIAIHCTGWHGDLDVRGALAVSCNPFFNETGIRLGWGTGLRAAFDAVGFGRAPRVGLPVGGGLLPDRRHWVARDTANVAMGQGDLLATPLQVAIMTMALANRGTLVQPRLVRDPGTGVVHDERVVLGRLDWNERDMDLVREGMRDAVRTWRGTGRRAAVEGLDVAGKTGTAQYRAKVDGVWERRKHAWMIAYAPADAPRYALAVLVEDAPNGGGTDAGPIVRELLLRLFPEAAAAEAAKAAASAAAEPGR
ncbi:MAG: hypothetical protein IJV65_04940 [Kiritimatiellae bacterium]|nr:hypothetical protein [Kiritimatiellia bacterium]